MDETGTNGVTVHDERIAVYTWRRGRLVALRKWAFDPTIIEGIWAREAPPSSRVGDRQPAS